MSGPEHEGGRHVERRHHTEEEEHFDFKAMKKGITMLKFGKRGPAHEKLFKLSGDKRYVMWDGRWFSPKLGKKCKSEDT
jgi:hypothetical protein